MHRRIRSTLAATSLGFTVASATPLLAQEKSQVLSTDHLRVRVETIASGLAHPWGLALLPDGRFLVTERNPGHLRLGTPDGDLSEPVEGVLDIYRFRGDGSQSQGGLFHVALHPDFNSNRLVYFSYSQPSPEGGGTAIARGRLNEDGEAPRLDDVELIFSMNIHDSGGLHFGGRFVFEPETNNILLTIGDRRNMSRAQKPDDHAGKIVRITDEGGVPLDNPFLNDAGTEDHIFSLGHRNSQGLAVHPATGEVWANEHGPLGGDEINLIKPGRNYGWPFQIGGADYSGAPIGLGAAVPGMEPPVHIWASTVAPSGLAIYAGELFPQWQGDLLHGGLAAKALVRTRIADGKVTQDEWMLTELERRIRDVQVASDGAVWLITDHEDGEVLRLVPEDPVATGTLPGQPPPATTGAIPGRKP